MKTAREILYKEMDKGDPLYEEDSIRLMKEYAKEAIKWFAKATEQKQDAETYYKYSQSR